MLSPIPITIVTGFLGAGKTTLLLSLIPQLPSSYKLCLLKNEFGDIAVDSKLASQTGVTGVTELLNGCICCNLVGQLSDALLNLKDTYKPSRIIIETSGSAFPATLAMEVNRIAKVNRNAFTLDGVVQVIDVENWAGYEDTSYTAKLQSKFTDLIVLNKHEIAAPGREDQVLDRIRDVAEDTPVVRSDRGWIDKDVVFGIDTSLARELTEGAVYEHSHDHTSEVDVLSVTLPMGRDDDGGYVCPRAMKKLLETAPRDEVYRIKGVMRFRNLPPHHPDAPTIANGLTNGAAAAAQRPTSGRWILNWAFGRWTFTPLRENRITTTIQGSKLEQAPLLERPERHTNKCVELPECHSNKCVETEELLANCERKGSIEVMVETCIKIVVEQSLDDYAWDCARLTVVLGRGEGQRWKTKLQREAAVRYDNGEEGVKIEVLV